MRSATKRREALSEEFVPYRQHVEHWALALDDGSVLGGFRVPGRAWETADPDDVDGWHNRLNQMVRSLASAQLVLSVHVVRTLADVSDYPEGNFTSAFARELDAAYRDRMLDRRLYRNDLFLFVLIRPFAAAAWSLIPAWVKGRLDEEGSASLIKTLGDKLAMIEADLAEYGVQRLATRREGKVLYSELAEALHTVLTTERRKIPVTTRRIARGIYRDRIVVGWETVEIRGLPRSTFASAFVLYEYPAVTWPGQFNNLLSAPYAFSLTQSFAVLSKAAGHQVIGRKQNQMAVGGDKAISQREQLTEAADDLASNRFVMGTHHLSLVVFADSLAALAKVNARAVSDLADSGAVASHAHLELTGTLWAQLPGNLALRSLRRMPGHRQWWLAKLAQASSSTWARATPDRWSQTAKWRAASQ
jgi:type IV secretion system protein VirB4